LWQPSASPHQCFELQPRYSTAGSWCSNIHTLESGAPTTADETHTSLCKCELQLNIKDSNMFLNRLLHGYHSDRFFFMFLRYHSYITQVDGHKVSCLFFLLSLPIHFLFRLFIYRVHLI
jgi:hypothetical protein